MIPLPGESAGATMRGLFEDQGSMFSYLSPKSRVPANHPLRKIRELVRDALRELSRSFSRLYAQEGRPSVPPEQLLSALLIQVFYGISVAFRRDQRLSGAVKSPRLANRFRSPHLRSGNWKIVSRDRRQKPAPQEPKC